MRLFKASQPAQSEEDRVRDLRLTSIASRYRPRPEPGAARELQSPPPEPEEAQG